MPSSDWAARATNFSLSGARVSGPAQSRLELAAGLGSGQNVNENAASVLARLDRIPIWPWRYRILWIVGAAYFFAFFDIVNIGSALPEIVQQFGVTARSASLSISMSLLGFIIGSYLIATIADRWGRRPSLVLSVALYTLGSLGAAF